MHPGLDVTTRSGVAADRLRRLAAPELCGHGRLRQVEDARAAAADIAFGNGGQRQSRNVTQQRARLRPHALRMGEVAGIVIGHPRRDGMAGGTRLDRAARAAR